MPEFLDAFQMLPNVDFTE